MFETCGGYSLDEIGVFSPSDDGLGPFEYCRGLLFLLIVLLAVVLWLKLGGPLEEDVCNE